MLVAIPFAAGLIALIMGAWLMALSAMGSDGYLIGGALHLAGVVTALLTVAIVRLRELQHPAAHVAAPAIVSEQVHVEPELRAGRPRNAYFRTQTQLFRFCLIALLVAWVGSNLWLLIADTDALWALHTDGATTLATVIGKERLAAGVTAGDVHYAFRVGNVVVEDVFSAPRTLYPQMRAGNQILVTYLPAQPHIHQLGRVDTLRVLRQAASRTLFLLIGLAYLGLPFWILETNWRRELTFARLGIPTMGVITGGRVRGRSFVVGYAFALPDGDRQAGQARLDRPLPLGSSLTVLYDPERPWRNRAYAACRAVEVDRT